MNKRLILFALVLILVVVSLFMVIQEEKSVKDSYLHPDYKMEATYDREAKTIFWKGANFRESPLGTVHLTCEDCDS